MSVYSIFSHVYIHDLVSVNVTVAYQCFNKFYIETTQVFLPATISHHILK